MLTRQEMLMLLRNDVVPALGCTEPVAVALCVADAAKNAGEPVAAIHVTVNPGIYKNGMSVAIPKYPDVGLDAASALGALLKNPEKGLEVFEDITPELAAEADQLLQNHAVTVDIKEDERKIYVRAEVTTAHHRAVTIIRNGHTQIVEQVLDGTCLYKQSVGSAEKENDVLNRLQAMTLAEITALVEGTGSDELAFLDQGIAMNRQLAVYDLQQPVGVGIAKSLEKSVAAGRLTDDVLSRIIRSVAGAAEGRLGGCPYPTMSSSGAGTKGLVVILPISEVADALGVSAEKRRKALAIGHLLNRYINLYLGKLAPVCTCVMAAAVAASGAMTWLLGGDARHIGYAIRNMTGTVTGMICDGGKVGCALKVSMATGAAYTNALLAADDVVLRPSDGIVDVSPEQCIRNMAKVGTKGMLKADAEILDIMLHKQGKLEK